MTTTPRNDTEAREAEITRIYKRLCGAIARETRAIVGAERMQEFSVAYHLVDAGPEDELSAICQRFVRGEASRDEVIAGCTKALDAWKKAAHTFVEQEKRSTRTAARR